MVAVHLWWLPWPFVAPAVAARAVCWPPRPFDSLAGRQGHPAAIVRPPDNHNGGGHQHGALKPKKFLKTLPNQPCIMRQ
jgi:hypothetical protein